MVNPLELTFYARTGYNPSDEPASDAVIDLNEHWTMPLLLKEYDPANIQLIAVQISDGELHRVDYLKIRDTITGERWYYYVAGHKRRNERYVEIRIILDNFATVGLQNISFFGNVARRSLSEAERESYPLLAEPWAPRRPLKTRRIIIDLNVNKKAKLPSHVSLNFEEETTNIENEQTIQVPNSPLNLVTSPDSLSFSAELPMGYPNPAEDTTHTIQTPWGSVTYTTPYEQYYTLGGSELATYLAKAKKYNALDLLEPPYYVPNPGDSQHITVPELSNPNTKNPKASRYYTTITIRSLASNSSRTYSENDTRLQYDQELTIVIAPDKNGGIYVLPSTLRDTGLNVYTYLEGVFSPFETLVYNAVGDTPAKYAADGTLLLNTALNELFQTYTNKVNAMQYQGMQAKYFKDLGTVKGVVMTFASEVLGLVSNTVTTTEAHQQVATSDTSMPAVSQRINQTQSDPGYRQTTTSSGGRQTQRSYSYKPEPNTIGQVFMPDIYTDAPDTTSSSTVPPRNIDSSSNATTDAYSYRSVQTTNVAPQTTHSSTTQQGSSRSVEEGNSIAVDGIDTIYDSPEYGGGLSWGAFQRILFGGYRNEVHAFMLGNINDYLNRWVSIQNDMHNGKVANLFKNITLVGNYSDHNKLAGKYEILIASLQPEDEHNFDLFLEHFGHAVDEYTGALVKDVRDNYNYTMVGEDAILANNVHQDASAPILNQFRTGVRVWKTLIRPENY